MIHVRLDGRSYDLFERDVAVSAEMNDAEILSQIAGHFDSVDGRLDDHIVDRPRSGDLIVRPEAVYG